MTSHLPTPCVRTTPSAVCIYASADRMLVICCPVSTGRGQSRLTEAEAGNPVQGTASYAKEPECLTTGQEGESAATNTGGITNHSDVLACSPKGT